jgi:predicted RecB family endonuclease
MDRVAKAHEENERGLQELREAHKETEKAQKEAQRIVANLGSRFDDMERAAKAHSESMDRVAKAHEETEKALKETQRIVGDLGNKFGDEAEHTLIPALPEKFKYFGFDFGAMSRNRKINNDKYDIHAEIDAFLENGTQAMAVEVKAKLQKAHVDEHVKRMEKLRKYADLFGDRRELFGAMAATVVDENERDYALANGFYVIEPSGEDVKVTKPASSPRVW